MPELKDDVREYWEKHPNAVHLGQGEAQASRAYYETIAAHRYRVEPCILEMAEFKSWPNKRVLEIGCGIGTDLRQFASAGAKVVGIDLTWQGISMARRAFTLFGLDGDFVVADAEALPFRDDSFDLVYSNGVIHHTPDTRATVREIYRVTVPSGQARIMIYHRDSYFALVIVRMIIAPCVWVLSSLFPKGALPGLLEKRLPPMIRSIYGIVVEKGYSIARVFAASTDPSAPGAGNANPLARAYSKSEAKQLFSSFRTCELFVRQLYSADFLPVRLHRWMERRYGWFLFIRAAK